MGRTGDAIDIGPPPYPTDRELELALDLARAVDASQGTRVSLLTEVSRLLARYRVELDGRGRRDVAYSYVESDLRTRRIDVVMLRNSVRYIEKKRDNRRVRAYGPTLLDAVRALERSERELAAKAR